MRNYNRDLSILNSIRFSSYNTDIAEVKINSNHTFTGVNLKRYFGFCISSKTDATH